MDINTLYNQAKHELGVLATKWQNLPDTKKREITIGMSGIVRLIALRQMRKKALLNPKDKRIQEKYQFLRTVSPILIAISALTNEVRKINEREDEK